MFKGSKLAAISRTPDGRHTCEIVVYNRDGSIDYEASREGWLTGWHSTRDQAMMLAMYQDLGLDQYWGDD